MTADQMFEKLGYEKVEDTFILTVYRTKRRDMEIEIYKKGKCAGCFYYGGERVNLDFAEIKAISKFIDELEDETKKNDNMDI